MLLQTLYQACDSANVDASGVCSAPIWVQVPTLIPCLSLADGAEIAVAILTLWALAWGIRSVVDSIHVN
ncbi:hypothetical protein EKH79_03100 [Dyella dinghuensis]|uniref:Uncharacterized protein n=1 Tax=Dyella dinghuensis TaxID=1920169 RepID=A0A3S0S607_9GAMM|nr:hypothetical protein [Dyella dinghuensis]RUL66812.1 hypothetical protein EKH79_03100 [Dyella dinghuensis]